MEEEIDEIRNRIRQKPDLVINRVPENTLRQFKELVDKSNFCEDYGFGLKFLMDFYIGLIPSGVEHLELEIQSLHDELAIMKQKSDTKEEKPVRKMLGEKKEE